MLWAISSKSSVSFAIFLITFCPELWQCLLRCLIVLFPCSQQWPVRHVNCFIHMWECSFRVGRSQNNKQYRITPSYTSLSNKSNQPYYSLYSRKNCSLASTVVVYKLCLRYRDCHNTRYCIKNIFIFTLVFKSLSRFVYPLNIIFLLSQSYAAVLRPCRHGC